MTRDTIIITTPPQTLRSVQGWDVTPGHLAYRVGRGPHLLRAGGGTVQPRGGIMVVDDQGFDGLGDPGPLCQEVVRECSARGFTGAVLDFDAKLPPLERMAATLEEGFARRGWTLYVPESYGARLQRARVMISSALSGGSLALRLEEASGCFGADRVALALQRVAEDFALPSSTGNGQPLTREELAQKRRQMNPSVFFSGELCARYFTYMNREGGAHFVLFDDGDTLRRKMEVARRAGIHTFLAAWPEVADCVEQLGLQRAQSRAR